MTVIKGILNDQSLIAAEKVKIASGDIDSVFFEAEFDEPWNSFVSRTASFHTSHDATPVEVLMNNNQCVVPARVLDKPGTLYVGVIGVTADGTAVKTSAITGFRISQGANHAYTTVSPILSLYQQFLSAVKAEADPILSAAKAELQALYDAFTTEVETYMQGEVLWTNPDDTQIFERQTVHLDLAAYKRIVIRFKHHATDEDNNGYSESSCNVKEMKYHHSCYELIYSTTTGANCGRSFRFMDSGVSFVNGLKNGEANDNVCIPVEIRAFKY